MVQLGVIFENCTCPKCNAKTTTMCSTEIYGYGTRIRRSILDACPKCLHKITNNKEFDRKLTSKELERFYPNNQSRLKRDKDEDKRTNKRRSSRSK